MKQIIKDDALEKSLKEDGYIVVPFLTEAEVKTLKEYYYEYHPATLEGMYATAHVPDLDMRVKMNTFIKETFARAIGEIFVNANPLGGSYIAKGKGQRGTLNPHQDWNIVDEEMFRSFNIWVPLVDLRDDNGIICVMPASHTWKKTYRSANTNSVYQQVDQQLWEQMTRLHMKAGEALIYDHRLIHASGENNTEEIRLATVYGIIPDEAQMMYYHQKNEDVIEVYESNPDFFLYGNIFEGPKGLKVAGEFQHRQSLVTAKDFDKLTNTDQGLMSKVRAFFKV